jgi:hypothetical protein
MGHTGPARRTLYSQGHRVLWAAVVGIAFALTACRAGPRGATPSLLAPAATPLIVTAGPLSVSFTSPQNEAVVSAPQVVVAGNAPPETVISVNDAIVVVDASGAFSTTVPLQEGPNELDIVASDPAGNQARSRLVVTYDPSS